MDIRQIGLLLLQMVRNRTLALALRIRSVQPLECFFFSFLFLEIYSFDRIGVYRECAHTIKLAKMQEAKRGKALKAFYAHNFVIAPAQFGIIQYIAWHSIVYNIVWCSAVQSDVVQCLQCACKCSAKTKRLIDGGHSIYQKYYGEWNESHTLSLSTLALE